MQRATLTVAELNLLRRAQAPLVDADATRKDVQSLEHSLRAGSRRERDALMPDMYRWAYSALSGR